MRHGKKFNHLGRTSSHRKALMKNMAIALIEHKRINTTTAKAKSLRRYIEPLVTRAKNNTTHSRRVVFSYLQNKKAVTELFGTIADKVGGRPGGYVRVIKTGFRKGDAAEMSMIEFVDFNEVYNGKAEAGSGKKKRTRRGKRKSSGAAETAAVATSVVADAEDAVENVTNAGKEEE